jgi:hypothetical protein
MNTTLGHQHPFPLLPFTLFVCMTMRLPTIPPDLSRVSEQKDTFPVAQNEIFWQGERKRERETETERET